MIQYDSTELLNATYVPRFVKHESAPNRLLSLLKLARQDGSVIVDDTFDDKYIDIQGYLTASSAANLEAAIDSFKELISRKDKNLDIAFASGTRRYVCRSVSHEFDRDHFHLLYVPYTIRFFVVGMVGKDTSETTALNLTGQTAASISSGSITYGGTYQPKLRHKITITTRGNADTARITNAAGDYIEVDLDGIVNGDYIEIDEENQTVKKNGSVALNWRGKFPSVSIGAATLTLTIGGSSYTLDQYQTNNHGGSRSVIYDNTGGRDPIEFQSFVPTKSGRRNKLSLFLSRGGTPGGNVLFQIHEDNNGVPGAAIGGNWQPAVSGLDNGSGSWFDLTSISGSAPFLVAGRKYWIRNFSITGMSGTDASNFMGWHYTDQPTQYANGKAMAQKNNADTLYDGVGDSQQADAVQNGSFDFMFQEFVGDGNSPSWTLTWQIYYTKKYL